MDSTHQSLLIRIRDRENEDAWRTFHTIYSPFLYQYVRRRGLQHSDAEDICSHCMSAVAKNIERFNYDRQRGGFRNWLRRTAINRIIDVQRKKKVALADVQQFEQSLTEDLDLDRIWQEEWADRRLKLCVDRVRERVAEMTFQAFYLLVVQDKSVEDVCGMLSLNANQVYKAKSTVLRHLREEMAAFDTETAG